MTGPILTILAPGSEQHAEIASAAVQGDAVDVIDFASVAHEGHAHDRTVQAQRALFAIHDDGPLGVALVVKVPAPLVDPIGGGGIDYRVSADAAISGVERDACGILVAHRETPSLGVTTPADLAIGAGFRRVNYTSPLRVEVA